MLTKMPSQQQTTNRPSSSLQQLNSRSKKKLVNVSVTILSIDGLHVKDTTTPTTKTKKKGGFLGRGTSPSRRGFSPSRRKNNTKGVDNNSNTVGGGEESCATSTVSASVDTPTTTIVASFSRIVKTRQGGNKTVMTHVPSLPLSLSSSNDQDDDDGTQSKKKKNKSKAVKTSSSVFHWPTAAAAQPSREGQQQSGVSTPQQPAVDISHYQFKHPLIDYSSSTQEDTKQQQAQQPSIQISISRAGRMFKLGTATIPIDTSSTSSSVITVLPVVNCNSAIPKKKSSISSLSTATATVPMMKLKDTQIKCGLSPNATLRVLLNVTHPIGETTQISDRINVTMISSSMIKEEEMRMEEMKLRQEREIKTMMIEQEEEMKKKRKQEIEEKMKEREKIEKEVQVVEKKLQQRSQQQGKQEEKNGKTTTSNKSTVQVVRNSGGISKDDAPLPSTSTSMSRAITLTALAAVKEEKTFDNDEEIPLTHPDDEDTDSPNDVAQQVPQEDNQDDDYQEEDEPSCTSSAYMSVALFKNNTRSFSTAATDVSSVVSDLTDVHSWLSQTGIEVIPFAGVSDDKNDATTLPLNSRFHDVQVLDEEESIASPINNVDTEDHDASVDTTHTRTKKEEVDSCRPTSTNMKTKSASSFPHRDATRSSTWSLPTPKKNKMTWRQRLTCGGLVPLCGGGHSEEEEEVFNVNDDDNIIIHDALSEAVDEDDVISTNKYSLANLGQCEAIKYQPSSYYTEDDTSFVEYVDDDDEVSEQSDDESYVSETSSKDEFTMNEKYIEGIIFD